MSINPTLHAQRRARLAAQLGEGGVAIVPTASEAVRNRDSHFPYRHDSYFYYLTGFTEPNATLVLFASGESWLFCQPKDLEREIWDGIRLGPQAAVSALGVTHAWSSDERDARMADALANQRCVWYPFATHTGLVVQIDGWLQGLRAKVRMGVHCPSEQRDLCALLDEMRLVKDAHEIDIMRRAGRISAQAHVRAMQCSARMLKAGQDVREYHLDAELMHEFRRHGSQSVAYTSIVARVPMPACCITAPMRLRFARVIWC